MWQEDTCYIYYILNNKICPVTAYSDQGNYLLNLASAADHYMAQFCFPAGPHYMSPALLSLIF